MAGIKGQREHMNRESGRLRRFLSACDLDILAIMEKQDKSDVVSRTGRLWRSAKRLAEKNPTLLAPAEFNELSCFETHPVLESRITRTVVAG